LRTSEELQQGAIYTRADLREQFGITDKTLDTGIYKPPDQDSVWLFITESKTADMTAYRDKLEGDVLRWDGQTAGLKDPLIREHAMRELELVVFYRPAKDYYPGYGFRFEGPFEYISESGSGPTSFVLQRETRAATPSFAAAVGTDGTDPEGPAPPPAAGNDEADLVGVLAQLRQSGRDSVVAENALTLVQREMHVPDEIENWVAARIDQWRADGARVPLLVVLSGNAGDGKSDLIERLRVREGVAGDDLAVVADATHSESPSESQAERLVEALSGFVTPAPVPAADPHCVLIAMNVGMVIAFFKELEGTPAGEHLRELQAVLEYRLGLADQPADPPEDWECEVVNLDHRNLLGRAHDGLVAGMIDKLDPEDPMSIVSGAAEQCRDCPARRSCWVRTNLNLLRSSAVREAVHELLWDATLSSDLHLTPRNVWDLLFQVTTGGLEIADPDTGEAGFLSCEWIRERLSGGPQQLSAARLGLVHRRLLYQLIFQPPDLDAASRGPLLEALASADPIKRGGRYTHLVEGEVRATPQADEGNFSELALAADEPSEDGGRQPDPLLVALAGVATDPVVWQEDGEQNARELALGVSRRARVTAVPSEVHEEVRDEDALRFLGLLQSYASWRTSGAAPQALSDFWRNSLISGVGGIFGATVFNKTYFRLDTLSPATRFPAYVPVDLPQQLTIEPDPVANSGWLWLEAVSYLPRKVVAKVDTGGQRSWTVPVDLQLYRLLSHVNRGYSASSVDLDAFFRLRYACERLGTAGEGDEIVFRALETNHVFQLEVEQQLTGTKTVLSRLGE
jgi:hypothetical protein